ncbi:MAG: hypothetical protein H6838_04680 [Planctomycetes bacterium]|nr:hypothetical protein [Planctomycetota bacterium]MCB1299460.1 hypothetical protein [Microthrixaceae bacterium]MCB9884762.1 hypothetical protein [Planctomycetota bacterium]
MVGRSAPVRSWRRACALAALTVWLPVLTPVVLGTLDGCGHCVSTYWTYSPIVPGVLVPVVLQVGDGWFAVVGVLVALLLFGGLSLVLRELPPPWSFLAQWVMMLAVGGQAYGFACALRA